MTVPSPEDRIRATYLVDLLDAVIGTLPAEARPSGIDPADCGHPHAERWHAPSGRMFCGECGTRLPAEDTPRRPR